LRDELAQALQAEHPLLVLVSLDGCPFCKLVRESYLSPLRAQQGVPVVQLDMRSDAVVQDFMGKAFTHSALARAWNVTWAPTLLFFGRGGAEVAPRLTGIGSADYYGAFLDQRLEQAQSAIRSP
jgi:thioredoxin-related protein